MKGRRRFFLRRIGKGGEGGGNVRRKREEGLFSRASGQKRGAVRVKEGGTGKLGKPGQGEGEEYQAFRGKVKFSQRSTTEERREFRGKLKKKRL